MFRLLLGFLLLGMGFPRVCADERILSFHSRIEVKDLGSLLVAETIRVRFEGKKREEDLYRDLPPGAHGKAVPGAVVQPPCARGEEGRLEQGGG